MQKPENKISQNYCEVLPLERKEPRRRISHDTLGAVWVRFTERVNTSLGNAPDNFVRFASAKRSELFKNCR